MGDSVRAADGPPNPTERRTSTCRLGLYATYVFENLNDGDIPRAQLWFASDGKHAFFVSLVGAPRPAELASVQRVIDRLEFTPIEKGSPSRNRRPGML